MDSYLRKKEPGFGTDGGFGTCTHADGLRCTVVVGLQPNWNCLVFCWTWITQLDRGVVTQGLQYPFGLIGWKAQGARAVYVGLQHQ